MSENIQKLPVKQRDTYFDCLKGLLIIFVVFAHYIGTGYVYDAPKQNVLFQSLFAFFYQFHMPAFVFISGFFSKKVEKARISSWEKLLLPYLVFNTIFTIINGEFTNPLLNPLSAMWYLWALFLWRQSLPVLGKIRFGVVIAIIFSVFCAFEPLGKTVKLFYNAIAYLPFFLMGFHATKERIAKWRKVPKIISALIVAAVFAGNYFLISKRIFGYSTLAYWSADYNPNIITTNQILLNIGLELLRYAIGFILMISVMNLCPSKSRFLAYAGNKSLYIMILHVIPGLRPLLASLNFVYDNTWLGLLYWVVCTLLSVILFGNKVTEFLYNKFMDGCAWVIRKLFFIKRPPAEQKA